MYHVVYEDGHKGSCFCSPCWTVTNLLLIFVLNEETDSQIEPKVTYFLHFNVMDNNDSNYG